ncbi:DNA mismatch repair protein [Gurleya vavrai]
MLNIETYGFRGEALSSISLVSKVSVQSKIEENETGFEAVYKDNKMIKINPVGINKGTKITINDIFYNNEIRRKYFYKRTEEITKIFYLIANYSIKYINIKFEFYSDKKLRNDFLISIKKENDELKTKKQIIKKLFKLNNQLLEIEKKIFTVFHSNLNYTSNFYFFILFINGRLVQNKVLKEQIKKIYLELLPKHKFPFVYLEINVNSDTVDVNIHPEKKEVIFFDEENIFDLIVKSIEENLQQRNEIKTFNSNILSSNLDLVSKKLIYGDPSNSSILEVLEDDTHKLKKK